MLVACNPRQNQSSKSKEFKNVSEQLQIHREKPLSYGEELG